jgi:hypothetical protein
VVVEKRSLYKPVALVKTEHSIIGTCHEARDEFRAAVWRDYMTSNRRIHICVYDFAMGPIEELFANCSASEVAKLQIRDNCRVYHYITGAFHKYRQSKNAYWEIVDLLDAWLLFAKHVSLDAKQSIEECDWYDARLPKTTMLEDKITHIPEWEIRWECLEFLELWDAVLNAYEER